MVLSAQKKKLNTLILIFRKLLFDYPSYSLIMLISLLLETILVSSLVLAVVPFADFILDPELKNPSKITSFVKTIFLYLNINPSFWSFGFLFVLLNLVVGISKTIVFYITLKFKYLIVKSISYETLDDFFNTRWSFFNNESQGRLLNTLSKELIYIGDTIGQILFQIALVSKLFVFLTIPIFLNFKITMISFFITAFLIIPFILLSKKNYELGKIKTSTANIVNGKLVETIQSAKIIISHGLESIAIKNYMKSFNNHMIPAINSQTITSIPSGIFPPLGILSVILAIGISLNTGIILSELAAILWSLLSAVPIISTILQTNLNINNFLPSFEQLKKLKDDAKKNRIVQGNRSFSILKNRIEFTNVSFAYNFNKKTISNFNAIFYKGTRTALIGVSGSGKSTIIDLLLGLQEPNEGSIYVDNVNLSNLKINDFRKKIGFVSQETVLFNDTIRNNILWSKNSASDKEIWRSLQQANAYEFVYELPKKLDTIIGDQGAKLSGGQRQRLTIARALLRNPEVLVLDEATSSLDYESENLIQESINSLPNNITIIIIAHRLSTIKNCDQILIIEKGKLKEKGSFQEISKQSNYFKIMLKNNFLD